MCSSIRAASAPVRRWSAWAAMSSGSGWAAGLGAVTGLSVTAHLPVGREGRLPVQRRQELLHVATPDPFELEVRSQLLQERIPLSVQGLLLLAESLGDIRQRHPVLEVQAQEDAIPRGQARQGSPQNQEGPSGQVLSLGLLDRGGSAPRLRRLVVGA